jgi:hypothetical protein
MVAINLEIKAKWAVSWKCECCKWMAVIILILLKQIRQQKYKITFEINTIYYSNVKNVNENISNFYWAQVFPIKIWKNVQK